MSSKHHKSTQRRLWSKRGGKVFLTPTQREEEVRREGHDEEGNAKKKKEKSKLD